MAADCGTKWRNRSFRSGGLLLILLLAGAPLPAAQARSSGFQVFLPLVTTRPVNPTHSGVATYYDANGTGSCMFDPSPDDLMVAAMNADEYDNAAYCGAYLQVKGPLSTITVRIVDLCPGCSAGHLDLSLEAFSLIANPLLGRVPIEWQIVSPEIGGPIAYHFKNGSNQWWTAVQVRNHRNPLAKLEYRSSGESTWIEVSRMSYNYFVESSGMGPGPYDFRVTDIYGSSLSDFGIPFIEDGTIPGIAQFPAGP